MAQWCVHLDSEKLPANFISLKLSVQTLSDSYPIMLCTYIGPMCSLIIIILVFIFDYLATKFHFV